MIPNISCLNLINVWVQLIGSVVTFVICTPYFGPYVDLPKLGFIQRSHTSPWGVATPEARAKPEP